MYSPPPIASLCHTRIYIYTRRRRRSDANPIPKWVTAAPPPSPSMGARCLLGGRSARLDGPVQGQRFGGEEKEDLSKLLYILGLEAEGFPTQKREACEACAEIEF